MLELSKYAEYDILAAFTIFIGAVLFKLLSVYNERADATGRSGDR